MCGFGSDRCTENLKVHLLREWQAFVKPDAEHIIACWKTLEWCFGRPRISSETCFLYDFSTPTEQQDKVCILIIISSQAWVTLYGKLVVSNSSDHFQKGHVSPSRCRHESQRALHERWHVEAAQRLLGAWWEPGFMIYETDFMVLVEIGNGQTGITTRHLDIYRISAHSLWAAGHCTVLTSQYTCGICFYQVFTSWIVLVDVV